MPSNEAQRKAREKERRARAKKRRSQLLPSYEMDVAMVPEARHAMWAARGRGDKEDILEAEKEFLARVNLAKKRKVKKQ